MRVFVTGATGFIGSAVVPILIASGHEVVGLARSDEGAAQLEAAGAKVRRGDLADTEGLAEAARHSDGVIHLGFVHDWSNFVASMQTDLDAVEAMLGALEGSGKPFINTSGTLMAAQAHPATEDYVPPEPHFGRVLSEARACAAADRGVRGMAVRLAPCVHDRTKAGLLTTLIPLARDKGLSAYVGDGENRWPAVHRLDAARLYCLALEKGEAGARFHATDEDGVPMHTIAQTVGEKLGIPVRSLTPEEAPGHFGFFAGFVTLDNPTTSTITREALGWRPREVGLLEDIREGCHAG
jgi:nucleoside-diphosphate-sugar epimerase